MYTVKSLPEFTQWLEGIKDSMTQRRLARRLEKATQQADIATAIALAQTL